MAKSLSLQDTVRIFSLSYMQGRINHCASCTMGEGPRRQPPPDQLPNFYHAVNVRTFRNHEFRGWNITTTKKSSTFWERKVHPEKILATRMRIGPRLTLVWGPEWLIRPCRATCRDRAICHLLMLLFLSSSSSSSNFYYYHYHCIVFF